MKGILMGIMMGFLQFPALAAVSQYFDKNRPLPSASSYPDPLWAAS
jgi:hypothetical protein